MESYIPISFLNDFIFCPRSIYFHQLYGSFNNNLYQQKPQIAGKVAHETIDESKYSSRKTVLQGIEIYSEKYRICGKIDIFDVESGKLSERKREIKVIYDGYVFQVYAHFYALTEMGFDIKKIVLYDLIHNKTYPIPLPHEDLEMQLKFEQLIEKINSFSLDSSNFTPLEAKCRKCIYSNLCDYSLC